MSFNLLKDKLTSFIRRKTSQRYRFDQQFANGTWDGLHSIDELGRYSIIAGYINFFCNAPRILDLGCGEGILQQRLSTGAYTAYLGIDFSEVAIGKAKKNENLTTAFATGDLNNLQVTGQYDAIIYNESIYYLKDPAVAIEKLKANLSKSGIFIFSIVDKHGKVQDNLWEHINAKLRTQDSTRVYNKLGHSWTIRVYTAD